MTISPLRRVAAGYVGALTVTLVLVGCTVDTESDTGILLTVTLHADQVSDDAPVMLDTLRFYVAVKSQEHPGFFVLNSATSGIAVDIRERDLSTAPYQLLINEDGDGDMETIKVVVVGEREGQRILVGLLEDPEDQPFRAGQIIERKILLGGPRAWEGLSWTSTDCLVSDDLSIQFGSLRDMDCDGYVAQTPDGSGTDCDDQSSEVNPGAEERYDCDGVDNDCDGLTDPGGDEDFDGDGWTACEGDCNDENDKVYPGAEEVCDGLDNDCNGKCDEHSDADGDGYTTCFTYVNHEDGSCTPVQVKDCDDTNDKIYPGAPEQCNGLDDNCNGLCDEDQDPDGDGYTECGSKTGPTTSGPGDASCLEVPDPSHPNPEFADCGPGDPAVHPNHEEICDGKDNNCDGLFSDRLISCFAWDAQTQPRQCRLGNTRCTETEGDPSWSACNAEGGELKPRAHCGLWPNCKATPEPALCMDANMQWATLSCTVRMHDGFIELCGGNSARPVYQMPFGFSGNTSCTWDIQLADTTTSSWLELGLIDPGDMGSAGSVVESCEAALVAVPAHSGGSGPEDIDTVISFYYDNGGGDYYAMLIGLTLTVVDECVSDDSMACVLTPP